MFEEIFHRNFYEYCKKVFTLHKIVVIDDRAKGAKDGILGPCSMTLRVDHKADDGMRYCEVG